MCTQPSTPTEFRRPMRSGSALIFVLAMLVLILAVALAFFSRAMIHRQIGAMSAAQVKTQIFSQTAVAILQDDIQHEIEAGSRPDPAPVGASAIRHPITVSYAGNGSEGMVAPAMVPQRVGDGGAANVLKVSRRQTAFFTLRPGYRPVDGRTPAGPVRASSISTLTAAANRRGLQGERWGKPRLMTGAEAEAFQAPDWIYLDRSGANPTSFSAAELKELSNPEPENRSFVIGRYAYVVYDVGGLINVNVVGNRLPVDENTRRGRLNQVSLPGMLGGQSVGNFPDFVRWRSPVSSSSASSMPGSHGVFDPKRNFIEVPAGEQAFVNRQDLLAYVDSSEGKLSASTLPFLTTFSRDINAPSYESNAARPGEPGPAEDACNPSLLNVRFSVQTVLHRPGSNPITVPVGTPVMVRRFPLNKLSLFEEAEPNADQMEYYFGLKRETGSDAWKYAKSTTDGRIMRLEEVAAEGREPNFFEVLQAVIFRGSLGLTGVAPVGGRDKYTYQKDVGAIPQWQVMQIGANIIDQWDGNDLPTTLVYPSGLPLEPFFVYGTENLPYVSQIGLAGWRPTDDQGLFQVWAVFDVWNPHQNAGIAPEGIDAFRIVPLGGTGRLTLRYVNSSSPSYYVGEEDVHFQSGAENLLSLNAGREFSFSASEDYSEPTTLGNTPTSHGDTPGLLIFQCRPNDPVANLPAEYGAKAYNAFRIRSLGQPPENRLWEFALQARHSATGEWHTYQHFEGFVLNQSDWCTSPIGGDVTSVVANNTHHSKLDAKLENEFYTWRSRGSSVGMIKIDPRTNRLGLSGWSQTSKTFPGNDFLGRSIRSLAGSFPDALLATDQGSILNFSRDWAFPGGDLAVGREFPKTKAPGFAVMPAFDSPPQDSRVQIGLFGFVGNNPETLDKNHPARYADPDGAVRPADGYFGGHPTARGESSSRPVMLNRPFRSVGELGYVFRDIPWKTIDFSSRWSADLGLLDAFSISETDSNPPLVAGPINLNTRQPETLAAVLLESSRQLGDVNPDVASSTLTSAQSHALAEAIVAESSARPFLDRGDLVTRVFHRGDGADPLPGEPSKASREAAIRALSEVGTTRTWNLMIDLIAQTGRFTKNASSGAEFTVQGEERIWIHLAIDRMTGEVLEVSKERVYED